MHAEISGTVDFYEKDDADCLERLRSLVALLPEANGAKYRAPCGEVEAAKNPDERLRFNRPRWPEEL